VKNFKKMDDENEMMCLMCLEDFDDDGDKLPRMLPECGHSVCSSCIVSRLKQNDPIRCPED
jgi:RING-type zinc-finger